MEPAAPSPEMQSHLSESPHDPNVSTEAAAKVSDLRSTILGFEKLAAATSITNPARQATRFKFRLGPTAQSKNGVSKAPSSGHPPSTATSSVQLLTSQDIGSFPSSTTIKELREFIVHRTGSNLFAILDASTRRPLLAETLRLSDIKSPIYIVQQSLGHLLANSALQTRDNSIVNADTASFLVHWWDGKQLRPVWLRFDLNHITVAWQGSLFRLFDPAFLRIPLVFSGIRGSEKGFQIVNSANRRSNRFFAQSVEQKHLISVHFCFVWRPSLVRRGVISSHDVDIMKQENAMDAPDPRNVAGLLRRHIAEMSKIIGLLETGCDENTARRYLTLFAQMCSGTGGYGKAGELDSLYGSSLDSFREAGKLAQDWHEKILKRPSEQRPDANNDQASAPARAKRSEAEVIEFGDFYDGIADPFDYNNASTASAPVAALLAPGEGGPPPPPPPPPPPTKLLPCIRRLQFGPLSAAQIGGTIWEEVSGFNMKDSLAQKLESTLNALFGLDVTAEKPSASLSTAGLQRYQNIEIALRMPELKVLSLDQLLDSISRFDSRLFCSFVLDKIVSKRTARSPEPSFTLLPDKEMVKVIRERVETVGARELFPIESFLLGVAEQVPDVKERFTFGYWMSKADTELEDLGETLKVVETATTAIRSSSKLKAALKLVLEVLTTMTPGYGRTKGFQISVVCNCMDTKGKVYNPDAPDLMDKEVPQVQEDAARLTGKAARAAKLERLRGQRTSETESWDVHLRRFLAVHLNRFEACQGFWAELLPLCSEAMKTEIADLSAATSIWDQVLLNAHDHREKSLPPLGSGDSFPSALNRFVEDSKGKLKRFKDEVQSVKQSIEELWQWFGETMVGEPTAIFGHVWKFCNLFRTEWKACEAQWDQKHTMVLRGTLPMRKPKSDEERKKPKAKKTRTTPKPPAAISGLDAIIVEATDVVAPPPSISPQSPLEEGPGGEMTLVPEPHSPQPATPPSTASIGGESKKKLRAKEAKEKKQKKSEEKKRKESKVPTANHAATAPSSTPSANSAATGAIKIKKRKKLDVNPVEVKDVAEISATKTKKDKRSKHKALDW